MFYFVSKKNQVIENVNPDDGSIERITYSLGQILHHSAWKPYDSNETTEVVELDNIVYNSDTKKYTPEFITEEQLNEAIYKRDSQAAKIIAQGLLKDSDWRITQDKFAQYSSIQQENIVIYREQLREVVRGNSLTIPELVL